MKSRSIVWVLLGIFVVGCAGVATRTPVPTQHQVLSPTQTAIESAALSTTAIRTPTATRTHVPASTPTEQRTVTSVHSPSPASTAILATPELIVRTLLAAPGQPGPLYALLADYAYLSSQTQSRFLVSNDFGKSWSEFAGGIPVAPNCIRNVNLDYASADALYASTCQGLYRWSQGRWNLISPQETDLVAIVYSQPNTIFAAGRSDKGGPVIRSTDGARTWSSASTGLVHFNGIVNLAIDPRSSNVLYAIIWPKYGGSYLRRGVASGGWSTMSTPHNNAQIEIGMTIDGASGALYVTAYNYVPSGDQFKMNMQVWRTTDPARPDASAIQWEWVHDFGADIIVQMLASGWSPQGLALYVRVSNTNCNGLNQPACYTMVQRSLDAGKTWAPLVIK